MIDSQLREVVGGEGGEGRAGGVDQQSTQVSCRWGGRGGQLTLTMERICNHFGRFTFDNVDPGGGSIDTHLGKDSGSCW